MSKETEQACKTWWSKAKLNANKLLQNQRNLHMKNKGGIEHRIQMTKEIENSKELVELVQELYTQNLNDRMTDIDMYKQGMEDMLSELIESKIVTFPLNIIV